MENGGECEVELMQGMAIFRNPRQAHLDGDGSQNHPHQALDRDQAAPTKEFHQVARGQHGNAKNHTGNHYGQKQTT